MKWKFNMLILGLLALIFMTSDAEALPMYKKQTGIDCRGCHVQSMPKLNIMGRYFAISGMTQSKKVLESDIENINIKTPKIDKIHPKSKLDCKGCHQQSNEKSKMQNQETNTSKISENKTMEDSYLNSMDINPSLTIKSRYEKTWNKPDKSGNISDSDTEEGEYSIPRATSFYLGGRLSENLGTLLNFSYRKKDYESISAKIIYSKKLDDGYIGSVLNSSSNFGPFSGMEVYNTGLYKPLRNFSIKTYSNAFQISGIGTGPVTSFQIYYDRNILFSDLDHFFGTFGFYAVGQDNKYMDLSKNLLPYARIAYLYPIGNFDVTFGAFAIVGKGSSDSLESLKVERETYGLDLQVEGELYDKSVLLTVSKVLRNKSMFIGDDEGVVSEIDNKLNRAFSIEGLVDLTPHITAKLAYLTYNDLYQYPEHGVSSKHIDSLDIDNAITVGFDYSFEFYIPLQVGIEHSWIKAGLDGVKDYRNFLITFNMFF